MKNKNITWAVLIALLAFFLRAYLAVNGPFEPDEIVYFTAAVKFNQAIRSGNWDQIINADYNYEHPQFNKLVYAGGLLPFGPVINIAPMAGGHPLLDIPYWPKLLGLRLISAAFGTASVFVVSLIHPLAGLFLALHTLEIKYTSVIYLEALPQLLCLLSMYSAMRALYTFQRGVGVNWRHWFKWVLLSAVAMGMTLASKYIYGVILIVTGISLLWLGWRQRGAVLLGLILWGSMCGVFLCSLIQCYGMV